MGCTSSKHVKSGVADVYKPPPSSFAVFDINAIDEPWLKLEPLHAPLPNDDDKHTRNKSTAAVIEKLEASVTDNNAPGSWDEVSKALQTHLNSPSSTGKLKPSATIGGNPPDHVTPLPPPQKSLSFHTVEELEATTKRNNQIIPVQKLRKTESASRAELSPPPSDSATGFKPVKENIFLVRDREQREKEGSKRPFWDPLSEFADKCPPGGELGVVVYTTSLRGVRRTYEDCVRVRAIMEQQGVAFDERDVALDAGVRTELRELLDTEAAPPRVFVKGRYVGGAAEVVAMNETGKLGRVMRWARVERIGEEGRQTCEGCGGARWLPCLECGGSCKIPAVEAVEGWERCGTCNENGLVRCPLCFTK